MISVFNKLEGYMYMYKLSNVAKDICGKVENDFNEIDFD